MGLVALAVVSAMACKSRNSSHLASQAHREASTTGETWTSTTHARGTDLRMPGVTIREQVRFDAKGRLAFADTHVQANNALAETHIICEPGEHRVIVERGGQRVEWIVPGDEPWILAPVRGLAGQPIATPLVAWATWRTTRDSEWVRLVSPLDQRSDVVPRDQYVVDRTVIVGDQAVEIDAQFVQSISIGGVALSRSADASGTFRFLQDGMIATLR